MSAGVVSDFHTLKSVKITAGACVVSSVARVSAPMTWATSAVPLQSITAPTSMPLICKIRPASTTTSASGVFHCERRLGVEKIRSSASNRNFSWRYGNTQTRPILTAAPSIAPRSANASANSRVKPSFRKKPDSSYSPQRVVRPLKPPVPPGAGRASRINVEQPARDAQTAAAIPAAPLPMTAMSTRVFTG